jgi:hypothetical protein
LNENGSRLLTIEFLFTLQLGEDEISIRLFNQSFSLSWKNFNMLNFHESCKIDVENAYQTLIESNFGKTFLERPFVLDPVQMKSIILPFDLSINGQESLCSIEKNLELQEWKNSL